MRASIVFFIAFYFVFFVFILCVVLRGGNGGGGGGFHTSYVFRRVHCSFVVVRFVSPIPWYFGGVVLLGV